MIISSKDLILKPKIDMYLRFMPCAEHELLFINPFYRIKKDDYYIYTIYYNDYYYNFYIEGNSILNKRLEKLLDRGVNLKVIFKNEPCLKIIDIKSIILKYINI